MMMMMMTICGSCYVIESDIFVLPVSFRTYSVTAYMHAVRDMIVVLSLVPVGFIYEYF
jgi:hypothetical protein